MLLNFHIASVFFILYLLILIQCHSFHNSNFPEICLDTMQNQTVVGAKACNALLSSSQENFSCKTKIDIKNATVMETKTSPVLLCRDYNSVTITWNTSVEFYFFEYRKIGTQQQIIQFTEVLTNCNIKTLNKLSINSTYNIRLWSYSSVDKILFRSPEILANTLNIGLKRTPVRKLNYTLFLSDNNYNASVKWSPGSDLSCLFHISWNTDGLSIEIAKKIINLKFAETTEFNITNLELGRNYYIAIWSTDKIGKESTKRWLTVTVPTCLDTYKNLSCCPPDTPENLTIKFNPLSKNNLQVADIVISWKKPKFDPNYYYLQMVLYNSIENATMLSQNVLGALCSATFQNVTVGGMYYDILLIAYSDVGSSKASIEDVIKNPTAKKESRNFIWIWIFLGFVVVTIIIILMVIKHKMLSVVSNNLQLGTKLDNLIIKCSTRTRHDSKWEINESRLILDKVIGVGAFGIVQKGFYNFDGNNKNTEVAIKMLRDKATDEQISQFYDEIEIMKAVPPHSNIVRLIGIVTKFRQNNPLLLVEYCSNGDLLTLLKKAWLITDENSPRVHYVNDCMSTNNRGPLLFQKLEDANKLSISENKYVLRWKDLLSFARQIAIAMEYLSKLHIIHRDLAARNILISENDTIKVSDFGLSRNVRSNNMYQKVTGGMLPIRWMALESLTYQIYTTESDVWSFGIVLWEIVTLGETPYPKYDSDDLVLLLKGGYRMKKPINCKDELYDVMLRCWNASPNLRPTFTELREIIDKFLESEVFYVCVENGREPNTNDYVNTKEILI